MSKVSIVSTRISNIGTQQVTKRFPNREQSHIQRLEMFMEVTFHPFDLIHRKDSGRIKSIKVDNIGIPRLNINNKLESDNRLNEETFDSQFKPVFTHGNFHFPQEPSTNIPPMSDITITR